MMRYLEKVVLAAVLALFAVSVLPTAVNAQGIGLREFEKMKVPTRWRIERGQRIYENQCSGCHGSDGTGLEQYPKQKFGQSIPDLTDQNYRYGGSVIEIYNVMTEGPSGAYHPTYDQALRYQERWAVAHFLQAWSVTGQKPTAERAAEAANRAATEGPEASAEVVEEAKVAAEKGRCKPDVMKSVQQNIGSQLEPKGEEQIQSGQKLYKENGCTACHGAEGKVNPGMKGLEIPPRNLRTTDAKWQAGPNPLAIFNTLTNGARGQMRSYKNQISPEERWAIAHFLLEKWIPKEIQTEVGDSQLRDLCRQKSASEPPAPVWEWDQFDSKREAVDFAMKRLAADAPEERVVELREYGPIELAADADPDRGEEIFRTRCARCHGTGAQGKGLGPFGVERITEASKPLPRLRIQVRRLVPAHAGGTFREFARRSTSGVHATLPGSAAPSLLKARDWRDLQAYIASLEGDGDGATIRPERREVPTSETGAGTRSQSTGPGGSDAGTASGTSRTAGPDAGSGADKSPAPATQEADAD